MRLPYKIYDVETSPKLRAHFLHVEPNISNSHYVPGVSISHKALLVVRQLWMGLDAAQTLQGHLLHRAVIEVLGKSLCKCFTIIFNAHTYPA